MKKQILFILIVLSVITSCKSTGSDRIKKDIIGINEQLYQLEKSQITTEESLKKLSINAEKDKKSKSKISNNNIQAIYSKGYRLFLEENYPKAIQSLKKIVVKYQDNRIVDNSLFWMAESYFKLNKFKQALNYYKLIYRHLPFSEKADYALFKIGYIYFKQKNYSKSDIAFLRILKEYPDSEFRKSSLNYRRKIKKNRRRK